MQRSGHGQLSARARARACVGIRLTRRTSAQQQFAHKVRGGRSAMLLREGEGRLLIPQPPLAGPWPASSPRSSHRFGEFLQRLSTKLTCAISGTQVDAPFRTLRMGTRFRSDRSHRSRCVRSMVHAQHATTAPKMAHAGTSQQTCYAIRDARRLQRAPPSGQTSMSSSCVCV